MLEIESKFLLLVGWAVGQEVRIYAFILILFPSRWFPVQIVEGWLGTWETPETQSM